MKKWVAALRSGKYEQGQRRLVDDRFCCLSVLCNIAPNTTGEWKKVNEFGWAFKDSCNITRDGRLSLLPLWSGLV